MARFYFTFGSSEEFPYQGGWVEVLAKDIHEAFRKFRAYFPNRQEGILNCSDYYTEQAFESSGVKDTGNRGAFCHKTIQ